ncbi:hypothetical protein [Halalkalicoccus sp. NIPERK01]|uniref:hypothetical protein n=1 Tax=Halalkalicoccus sp. NIPERK01 TaxID=3053469 RepID=UPI00256F13D3|nr:hypothetical protein [Halalkalicoccus sp. NIPERK01]MDL5361349.1 hypothetical protein [Halalkalicoccus sp. NIPERK01]
MTDQHDDPDQRDEPSHETSAEPVRQSTTTGDYERAPQDFESDIDPRAVRVPDHPVKVFPKVRGKEREAAAYLVTQGDFEEYLEEAPDDPDSTDFGVEAIVELLNEKYVSPDFDLTVEDYRKSPAGYYDEFFNQIVPEMGN